MSLSLVRDYALWLLILLVFVLGGCTQKDNPVSGDSSASVEDSPSSQESDLEGMQDIEERVAKLRGLETLQPVTKAFLTTDELRQRMTEDLLEDYSEQEARDDVLLYVAFEFMEPDVDLFNLLLDLQTEQVLGFYDPDTEEMYVVKENQEPGALERMTFSHEYTHVLQDQHFDLQALGFTDEGDKDDEDSEAQFAIRSLVEGDATLLMQQYALQFFSADDLAEIIGQSAVLDSSVLDSAPNVIRETLTFQYDAGIRFVTTIFQDGGWPAVDAVYDNPPVSTEQIMHPDRYPDDHVQVVALPPLTDTLGTGWRLVDNDVLGEFGLLLYLNVHADPSDADRAAEGWGGDRYAVHWREDESAFVLVIRLAWDTLTDADEFFDSFVQFAKNRFEEGPTRREGDARLWWSGNDVLLLARNGQNETLILIAPNNATLDAIHSLFPNF